MQCLAFFQHVSFSSNRLLPVVPVNGISNPTNKRSSIGFPFRVKCISSSTPSLVVDATRFAEAAKQGNLVPLHRCIFSDQLTPVTAYRCLVKEEDHESPSFLFESVEPGFHEPTVGRYSVVGARPTIEVVARENKVTIMDHEEGCITEEVVEDPIMVPRKISESWKPQLIEELPDTFCGGWVGYFSYDAVRYTEKKKLPFSKAPEDDRNLADINLGLYDDVIVFDHVEKKAHVIHWVRLDMYTSIENAYTDGTERLEKLLAKVQNNDLPRLASGVVKLHAHHSVPALKKSNLTSEEFEGMVLKAKEHIEAGDIFQTVLSQRFERRTFADPFEVYRALRVVNPSQHMAYMQARGCILVASSPEILTRVKKNKIMTRPLALAATTKRGNTLEEDEMRRVQLLKDPKQCEDHIMHVNVGRNDVVKVSKYGSVKVEKLMTDEHYSHEMHISSTITGELHDHVNCWDALSAALPIGTICGAPKVKAMELIDKLEATKRGPYGGGFGGISFNGDMNISVAHRTIVFPTGTHYNTMYSYKDGEQSSKWIAHLQVGTGVVADSDPDDKQQECQDKAACLAGAIDLAESAFVNQSCRLLQNSNLVPTHFMSHR